MTKADIITLVIAGYGAILSTLAILMHIFRDRVKVKVIVRRNMQMINAPKYQGMTLTIFQVTNAGRRPVAITSFGAIRLHPNTNFAGLDSQPQLPCEITEGKYITSYWDQADLDLSTIDYWAAWDSHGRVYKLQQASWFKHWKSAIQLRRSF